MHMLFDALHYSLQFSKANWSRYAHDAAEQERRQFSFGFAPF
jgi:hypothetical protein